MRNMKKFLALVLAMVMVFSMAVITTSAADEADYTDAAMQLNALSIMLGNESGDLMLDAGVTRYQTALFFVRALTGKTDTAVWNAEKTSANFADVQEYGTAIDYAYGVNVVKGRGNGVFGFNDPILYQDMIVMAVRALGYETADMQYPYGHILAAQKLELLEDIDNVNYKAEFKRGETAQLIWNMLNTEIAVTDPLSDKILYPGEEGLTEALTDKQIERTTLLVESGFASGTLEAVIVAFEEADEDDEDDYDKLTINYTYEKDEVVTAVAGVEIAAADLDITVDTPTVTYMGLPVTLYVDCAAEDFESDYADEEATIVFADFADYTVVKNDGTADNIKYVAATTPYLSLGGVKLADNKYYANVYTFGANGWAQMSAADARDLVATFEYDTSDNEYVCEDADANTYGQVAYRITDETVTFSDDIERTVVEILYTPYTFGQYVERELKYSVTGKTETFVIIGNLTDSETVNNDGEKTYVKETLLGTSSVVGENTTAVSKRNGELAVDVTVTGVEVESGDFMFYAYNPVDNILTVAANCGTIETGRMTATTATANKESVKIDGTNYKFGFDGLYPAFTAYNNSTFKGYISNLEAGKDNVQFLAVNDKIVFLKGYEGESDSAEYNFAIVTLDEEVMADLLDTTTTKYNNKLTGKLGTFEAGLYVDGGYVLVAMLNTESGEWELAKVKEFALDYADQDDDADDTDYDFTTYVDLATIAGYAEITTNVTGADNYVAAATALTSANIFMVVDEDDGVYTLAAATTVDPENDNAPFIESVENTTGLVFNTAGRTNLITASADVDAARVSTNEDTVIVAIGSTLNDVQIRKGVQSDKKSITGTVNFYAADADLIVLTAAALAENWGTGSALASDATYYVVLPETATEYGTTDDGESTLTISGLFDLKTMEIADDLVITADEMDDLDDEEAAVTPWGNLVYLNEDGELSASSKSIATALKEILAEEDDDAFVATVTEWIDDESITVKNGDVVVTDAANAIDGGVNATVITLDLTDIDWDEDVDVDEFFVGGIDYDADKYDDLGITEIVVKGGLSRYNYHADIDELVVEINEPTLGLYSQFEIDTAGKTVYELVDINESGVAIYTVDYHTAAIYDEDTETLDLYIVKLIIAK